MSNTPDDLLMPHQAAKLAGVHRDTIVLWSKLGKLPCILTVGGHRRFRRRDVEALLSSVASST